jgi:hypothetical protein
MPPRDRNRKFLIIQKMVGAKDRAKMLAYLSKEPYLNVYEINRLENKITGAETFGALDDDGQRIAGYLSVLRWSSQTLDCTIRGDDAKIVSELANYLKEKFWNDYSSTRKQLWVSSDPQFASPSQRKVSQRLFWF